LASEVVLTQIEAETGVALPGWTLLDHPTVRAVAALLPASSAVET
jgi:hypothetical protein